MTWVVIVLNGKHKLGCWREIQKVGIGGKGIKEVETGLFMSS